VKKQTEAAGRAMLFSKTPKPKEVAA
jgi:hypothetical protein